MSPRFGVVGLGRMAQALVRPWLQLGLVHPGQLQAVVASDASASRLATDLPCAVGTDPAPAWGSDVVLLAVKPQQLEAVAAQQAVYPGPTGRLLVSVLAGVTVARLESLFTGWRCVRAVPNTPALVRSGLTGLAYGAGVEPDDRQWLEALFGAVGEVLTLPEVQLDAFLALTSSGTGFVALVVEALADGAVAAGLPRDLALRLAPATLAGTAALLQQQLLHPGQLKDMVSSPGGTTIAGLRALERGGLRSALIEAVLAAAERSRQLG